MYPEAPEDALGASILMPGFVDAHCHLEWALTAGLAPGGEFGRWLGQISDPKITKSEDYKKCTELHRQFHLATAKVLALATSGQKAMAEKALGLESEFATTSARLTAAMMHWSRSS